MDKYEKLYKEAQERAKKLSIDGYLDAIAVEEIFPPEESEDERMRMALIKLMTVAGERYVMSATGFEKERLLAYLEKQKEQKPAEWSEEDEFFRQQLIVYCEKGIQDPLAAKCVDWLKSLRPSWKPSDQDELMKLKYAGTSTKLD